MYMPFPRDEIPLLKGRKRIITHRVSTEADKYFVGDFVHTLWNATYKCVKRLELTNVLQSPFFNELTEAQRTILLAHNHIAVLWLEECPSRLY